MDDAPLTSLAALCQLRVSQAEAEAKRFSHSRQPSGPRSPLIASRVGAALPSSSSSATTAIAGAEVKQDSWTHHDTRMLSPHAPQQPRDRTAFEETTRPATTTTIGSPSSILAAVPRSSIKYDALLASLPNLDPAVRQHELVQSLLEDIRENMAPMWAKYVATSSAFPPAKRETNAEETEDVQVSDENDAPPEALVALQHEFVRSLLRDHRDTLDELRDKFEMELQGRGGAPHLESESCVPVGATSSPVTFLARDSASTPGRDGGGAAECEPQVLNLEGDDFIAKLTMAQNGKPDSFHLLTSCLPRREKSRTPGRRTASREVVNRMRNPSPSNSSPSSSASSSSNQTYSSPASRSLSRNSSSAMRSGDVSSFGLVREACEMDQDSSRCHLRERRIPTACEKIYEALDSDPHSFAQFVRWEEIVSLLLDTWEADVAPGVRRKSSELCESPDEQVAIDRVVMMCFECGVVKQRMGVMHHLAARVLRSTLGGDAVRLLSTMMSQLPADGAVAEGGALATLWRMCGSVAMAHLDVFDKTDPYADWVVRWLEFNPVMFEICADDSLTPSQIPSQQQEGSSEGTDVPSAVFAEKAFAAAVREAMRAAAASQTYSSHLLCAASAILPYLPPRESTGTNPTLFDSLMDALLATFYSPFSGSAGAVGPSDAPSLKCWSTCVMRMSTALTRHVIPKSRNHKQRYDIICRVHAVIDRICEYLTRAAAKVSPVPSQEPNERIGESVLVNENLGQADVRMRALLDGVRFVTIISASLVCTYPTYEVRERELVRSLLTALHTMHKACLRHVHDAFPHELRHALLREMEECVYPRTAKLRFQEHIVSVVNAMRKMWMDVLQLHADVAQEYVAEIVDLLEASFDESSFVADAAPHVCDDTNEESKSNRSMDSKPTASGEPSLLWWTREHFMAACHSYCGWTTVRLVLDGRFTGKSVSEPEGCRIAKALLVAILGLPLSSHCSLSDRLPNDAPWLLMRMCAVPSFAGPLFASVEDLLSQAGVSDDVFTHSAANIASSLESSVVHHSIQPLHFANVDDEDAEIENYESLRDRCWPSKDGQRQRGSKNNTAQRQASVARLKIARSWIAMHSCGHWPAELFLSHTPDVRRRRSSDRSVRRRSLCDTVLLTMPPPCAALSWRLERHLDASLPPEVPKNELALLRAIHTCFCATLLASPSALYDASLHCKNLCALVMQYVNNTLPLTKQTVPSEVVDPIAFQGVQLFLVWSAADNKTDLTLSSATKEASLSIFSNGLLTSCVPHQRWPVETDTAPPPQSDSQKAITVGWSFGTLRSFIIAHKAKVLAGDRSTNTQAATIKRYAAAVSAEINAVASGGLMDTRRSTLRRSSSMASLIVACDDDASAAWLAVETHCECCASDSELWESVCELLTAKNRAFWREYSAHNRLVDAVVTALLTQQQQQQGLGLGRDSDASLGTLAPNLLLHALRNEGVDFVFVVHVCISVWLRSARNRTVALRSCFFFAKHGLEPWADALAAALLRLFREARQRSLQSIDHELSCGDSIMSPNSWSVSSLWASCLLESTSLDAHIGTAFDDFM